MRRARWAYLLEENEDFRRWYGNLARGSEVTAKENARVLYRFLRKHDMTPKELVESAMEDRRGVEDLLSDFVTQMHAEDYAPSYIANYLKAVRSWLSYNDIRLVRRIKIGDRDSTPTLEDERVPTRKEVRQILGYPDSRGRCSIAFMAFSGLRPKILGDASGEDGLEVRDLPEMRVEGGRVDLKVIPTIVVVRSGLSKAGHKYLSFLMEEGCEYLKAYLEERLAQGEEFQPETAVIAVKKGYKDAGWRRVERESGHITTKSVTKEIRDAMRPRFQWRPYVLRAYFDIQLLVAENHGKLSHAYRQFFIGHKGDMEAQYTTNKGRLPKTLIEDMRKSYRDCTGYLSTQPSREREDPELTTIRTMVESGVLDIAKPNVRQYLVDKLGIEDMDVRVAKMREKGLGEEEAAVTALCGELGIKPSGLDALKPKDPKRIVSEFELTKYLDDGWAVQTVLPRGRILVKRDY